MSELTPQAMVDKLMTDGFARNGPAASATTDPLVDTPMVLTLDQLRPYDHDPRLTRNPLYDEIKASIRERNLDSPPAVTRRPGEATYIIRNGGNTRLAVLRELWAETRDERFFRILCLFRPWSPRGEIVALTGHLAENELHGGLSFIERALGVEKARELYEQETGQTLSQSELARRLTADGFPVKQPHISRMQEAVKYLLPAIPNALYGGLGRKQVERLSFLRRACERVWDRRCTRDLDEFQELFQDVMSAFDGEAEAFSYERVQDELVGRIAEELAVDYDMLCLEVLTDETRHEALSSPRPPVAPEPAVAVPLSPSATEAPTTQPERPLPGTQEPRRKPPSGDSAAPPLDSPTPTTDRIEGIRDLVVGSLDDESDADLEPQCFPVSIDTLYPISDIWSIDASIDAPEHLRVHVGQLAREVAAEKGCVDQVEDTDSALGFRSVAERNATALPQGSAALLSLLDALSSNDGSSLGALLIGGCHHGSRDRLSDAALLKLFRLIRLARRLLDQDQAALASVDP